MFGRRYLLRRVLGGSRLAALGALHSTRNTRAAAPVITAVGCVMMIIALAVVTLLITAIIK